MKSKMNYEESSKKILELLAESLKSLKCSEGMIYSVFILLTTTEQRYLLLEWIVDECEKRTLKEHEILEQALKMSKKR